MYKSIIMELIDRIIDKVDDEEKEEAFQFLNELRDSIESHPAQFVSEFKGFIYDKALDELICPKCCKVLEVDEHRNELYCDNCEITY